MNKLRALVLGLATILIFQGCQENKKAKKTVILDGFTSGTMVFAADESFSPIVGEEEYVFRALYPDAKPVIKYSPESEVVNALLNDKVRVAIIARELDTTEAGILRRRALTPDVVKFAVDAVTIIVNRASNDTLTSVKEVISMLNGRAKTDKNIVFDNPN
jgi:phosphate transport system substrate-binding protein